MKQILLILCLLPMSYLFAQPGSLDPLFGNDGKVILDMEEYLESSHAVIQSNGKIIVSGYYRVTGRRLVLIRYNPDGSIDTSYGDNGVFMNDFPIYDWMTIALQPDGKVVATGETNSNTSSNDLFVLRVNTNGTLDTSFGNNGVMFYDFDTTASGQAIGFTSSNKIVIGAEIFESGSQQNFMLLRLNPDGSLDSSFGNNGQVITETEFGATVYDLKMLDDDGIVICGHSGAANYFSIVSYQADGSLNTDFGEDGLVVLDDLNPSIGLFNTAYDLELDGDNIYAIGTFSVSNATNVTAVKMGLDGTLDSSYGVDGIAQMDILSATGVAAAIDSEGRIVAAGRTFVDGDFRMSILRIDTDGTIDETFGDDGKTVLVLDAAFQEDATDLLIRPDGQILVVGNSATPFSEGRIALVTLLSGLETSVEIADLKDFRMNVFPNPATEVLHFDYTIDQPMDMTIALVNGSGQIVQTFLSETNAIAGDYSNDFRLDNQLPSGQYWVALHSTNGRKCIPVVVD